MHGRHCWACGSRSSSSSSVCCSPCCRRQVALPCSAAAKPPCTTTCFAASPPPQAFFNQLGAKPGKRPPLWERQQYLIWPATQADQAAAEEAMAAYSNEYGEMAGGCWGCGVEPGAAVEPPVRAAQRSYLVLQLHSTDQTREELGLMLQCCAHAAGPLSVPRSQVEEAVRRQQNYGHAHIVSLLRLLAQGLNMPVCLCVMGSFHTRRVVAGALPATCT